MSLDAISDEDFRKLLQKICQEDDWGIDKDFLNNTIKKKCINTDFLEITS